ncbi:histidine kinase, partial [Methylobacterium sp. NPDC097213]
ALILNEVLSAILKHADPARALHLTLRVAREGEAVLVEVEEDGSGTALEADGFATTLVDALTRQVDGTRQLRERQPSGSVIAFRFNAARVAV